MIRIKDWEVNVSTHNEWILFFFWVFFWVSAVCIRAAITTEASLIEVKEQLNQIQKDCTLDFVTE